MSMTELLDWICGSYETATVKSEEGIVYFENHLFYTEFPMTYEVEEWLRKQKHLEVFWE